MASSTSSSASVLNPDLALLFSRPWVLYKCVGPLPPFRRDSLVNAIESFDDEESTVPIFGEVSECTVDPISTSAWNGVAIQCIFKSGTLFRLIQYHSPAKEVSLLLLSTSGSRRSVLAMLDKVLGLPPAEELKLPSALLSSQLELYLEGLVPYAQARDAQSFIHELVGKVDITVTAHSPIAPNLRSFEIGIPAPDVWKWLSSPPRRGTFLARINQHIQSNTGMKLGLWTSPDSNSLPDAANATVTQNEPADPDLAVGAGQSRRHEEFDVREVPMTVSKVSCSAFILTTEGRLTMRKDPRSLADTALRSMIQTFNALLLEALLDIANDGG